MFQLATLRAAALTGFIILIAGAATAQTPEAYSNQRPPPKKTAPAPATPPPGHQGPPPGQPAPPPHYAQPVQGAPPQGFHGGPGPGGWHGGEHPHYGYYEFHERHYDRFSFEEQERWRGGYWRQDWHDGRYGWWWFADGFWYFYPQPIYPYPDYVADDYYREPEETVIVQPPADLPQPQTQYPSGPPPQQVWYYCDNPAGYSPYVTACSVPWRTVPVITQPPPQQ